MDILHFVYSFITCSIPILLPLLPAMNSAMDMCVWFLCGHMFPTLLGIYLGKIAGYMVTQCLMFWKTPKLFSIVAAPFYNSISSVWEF